MPPVDGYTLLPAEVRAWLDDELRARGFGDYADLTDELGERLRAAGWSDTPSLATVGRWGKRRKQAMQSTLRVAELLSALHDAAPDESAKRVSGLSTLIQDKIVNLLFEVDERQAQMEDAEDDATAVGILIDLGDLYGKLGRTVAQMQKADIAQRTHQAGVERAALAAAADRVEQAAEARGLSADDAAFWREQVLLGM